MINFKGVIKTSGALLFIEGFFMFISLLVSLIYQGNDILPLLISTIVVFVVGAVAFFGVRKVNMEFGKREGYIIVSMTWFIYSLFGALPFFIGGHIPTYTDAFFETMSGFTTTGASILNDIEAMPHGLLFWRSTSQWMGGMGMIVLSLAILPFLGIGGMQLFIAEVPGPTPDKLHPRIKETAKRLWAIYSIFTFSEVILLMLGGMSLFDAVNHSLTTMATGGYSTKQASVAYWDSPYIQYVITLFMFLAGCNFTLSYFALHLQFKKVWQNEEFRYYLGFILAATLLITVTLVGQNYANSDIEKSFRDAIFQVISIITTTGFATADYEAWGIFLLVVMFTIMFLGGSAGSTGGGMKIIRVLLLLKNSALEFRRLIHPNAIIPVRYNKRAVESEIITNVLAFIVFYMLIFMTASAIMATMVNDFDTAVGSVIACLGNIGPGIGDVGPTENFANIPAPGKWILSFLMLMGRLELFTVLILFSRSFWKR